jgi:hypothetical protein
MDLYRGGGGAGGISGVRCLGDGRSQQTGGGSRQRGAYIMVYTVCTLRDLVKGVLLSYMRA